MKNVEVNVEKFREAKIGKEHGAKLLGILIDFDLCFNEHVKIICKKAPQKLLELARMTEIIPTEKRKFC